MKNFEDIAKWLNDEKLTWALGASSVLYYNGYQVKPNDYDLFVTMEDFERVKNKLCENGELVEKEDTNNIYNTQGFASFKLEDIKIDLIAGFYVFHSDGEYRYIFDELSVDKTIAYGKTKINIMALEDWFILYQLIPGRNNKVNVISKMLKNKAVLRFDLFNRALKLELPEEVRKSVNNYIKEA